MDESPASLQQQLDEQIALNKAMEMALRVSRSGTFIYDAATRTSEWNAYVYELHGFPPDHGQVSYEELVARIPAEDREILDRGIVEAWDRKIPYEYIYRVIWPDDSQHWVGTRGTWDYDQDDTPLRFFGIVYDADDQKKLELALTASEQRLREAHEVSQIGAWEVNIETLEVTVSEEFCKIHGISQRRFNVRDDVLQIPKSDTHVFYTAFAQVSQYGREYDVEHRAVHGQSGDTLWIRGRGRGRFDDSGALVGLVGTNQDVTTRKLAEIAFLETARAFRALTQASPGLVFRADEQGQITFMNEEQWVEMSGLAPSAWQGAGWLEAVHPADQDRARRVWTEGVEEASPIQEEFRMRHLDGRVSWFLVSAQPVFDDQQLTSFVGTGVDVTALKTSERERATLQLALAESQKMEAVGTLAAGVAHDFNNFLAAVRGYVELARLKISNEDGAMSEQATTYLEQAEAAIDQAKNVTNGLLTFSRQHSIEHQPLCLNHIIADNVDLLGQLVPASIAINCHLPSKEMWIKGDSTQLRQILVNLVINSRDALGVDGGEVNVTLGFENQWATIVVQDSGRGMSREERERAIEPFFTTKSQSQGTGLGLSVVHGIVIAHEGELSIESKRGVGTQIEVRMPLAGVPVRTAAEVAEPEQVFGQQHILLVEDNPLVRESCALRMEASGYSIVTAEDGEQALGKLVELQASIDLALLDVDLPGANGVKVAAQMRKVLPDLQVIYVTGNTKNPALNDAAAEDLVLPKPIDFGNLFQAISERTQSGVTG